MKLATWNVNSLWTIECGIDRSFRKGPRPSDHAPLLCTLAR
jgi:exonuclease III